MNWIEKFIQSFWVKVTCRPGNTYSILIDNNKSLQKMIKMINILFSSKYSFGGDVVIDWPYSGYCQAITQIKSLKDSKIWLSLQVNTPSRPTYPVLGSILGLIKIWSSSFCVWSLLQCFLFVTYFIFCHNNFWKGVFFFVLLNQVEKLVLLSFTDNCSTLNKFR